MYISMIDLRHNADYVVEQQKGRTIMQKEQNLTGYPSIDKPWLKYYPASAADKEIPAKSAYSFIYDKQKNNQSAIALEYFGVKVSYGKVFAMIERIARSFKKLGVQRGDIVTLALPTMPETVYIFYALNRIGAISNLIDPRLQETEILQSIEETKSKVLVAIDMCFPVVSKLFDKSTIENIVILTPIESLPLPVRLLSAIKNKSEKIANPHILTWKCFLKIGKEYQDTIDVSYRPNMPITIVHTGGTTGVPKGVVLTNENFNTMALTQEISEYDLQSGDRFLTFLPPFYAFCLVNAIHDPLYLGFRNILIPKFDPKDFPSLMVKYKPNHLLSGPILWDFFIKSELTQDADLSYLKTPISGGDALNIELERDINAFFESHGCRHKVAQGYGMTEVSAAACFSTDSSYVPGSVGIPYVKNVVSIFDPDTEEELTYNQPGEVCIQTPTMMLEYYNNPIATAEVIRKHANGEVWLHTGDIGRITEDGNLFIDGRIKRMIVRNGDKIFPAAVEGIIMSHPAISNCVVVQMPNDTERHVPVAHLILNDSASAEEVVREVDEIVLKELPAFNLPYLYVIRKDLSLTGANKVNYKVLEEESKQYQDKTDRIVIAQEKSQ